MKKTLIIALFSILLGAFSQAAETARVSVQGNYSGWTRIASVPKGSAFKVYAGGRVDFGCRFGACQDSATAGVTGSAVATFMRNVGHSLQDIINNIRNPLIFINDIKHLLSQPGEVNYDQGGVWIKIVAPGYDAPIPPQLYYYWANVYNQWGGFKFNNHAIEVYAKAHDGGRNPNSNNGYGDNSGTYSVWLDVYRNDVMPGIDGGPGDGGGAIGGSGASGSVNDVDDDGLDDSYENALLEKYRPYFLFSIDNGIETFRPVDVLWYLQQSELLESGVEDSHVIMGNNILAINPIQLINVSGKFGPGDITKNHAKTNYHINPLETVRNASGSPGRHGLPWEIIRSRRNVGLYGHVVRANADYQRGHIQNQYNNYSYIKIEYWHFFGYNSANQPLDIGDHEGDWCTVQLLYDPATNRIVKVYHYAHGHEIQFDMTLPNQAATARAAWGGYQELHGVNYGRSFDLPGGTATNNTLRMYQDPVSHQYTHPIVYIERGTHEFWPTERGSFSGAPSHNGLDINNSYLASTPPNLGEVEAKRTPSAASQVILKYNGYWGAYSRKNSPPPGPILHTEWTWPANSLIRRTLADRDLEN